MDAAGGPNVGWLSGLPVNRDEMAALLAGYAKPSEEVLEKLGVYLELLIRWNARTNLTAIRDPKEMVRRHFGESLFAAKYVGACETLLDYGSGAGFPGLPIQLTRPDLRVTLAESQGKKAAFLREVVRVLGLETEVWPGRVDILPGGRRFGVVTLRAVDRPEEAFAEALRRVSAGGMVMCLSGKSLGRGDVVAMPGSESTVLEMIRDAGDVPRGTLPPDSLG